MDAAAFHADVYRVARLIPLGHVTSYGHIAKLIGYPRHARHVGNALKFLPEDTDIPWQRVVGSSGEISSRGPGTNGAARQAAALEEEGVEVTQSPGGGPFRVKLSTYGWFPDNLDGLEDPAEEEDDGGEAEAEDEDEA
ncbi:DNA binding methylated-DNA--cysteine S-methyltransferase [Clavulina sp. PMI_390]|nr:DNA binding methylated-DNA--cysteine S-methyltransferase [Clavulina sp. PMI_390]